VELASSVRVTLRVGVVVVDLVPLLLLVVELLLLLLLEILG